MWTWLKQVNRDRNLPPSKTAVAVVLADHSNYAKPDTWPSAATIAEESGLAKSSVTETLAKLAAGGHLETTPGKKGRGHSRRHRHRKTPACRDFHCQENHWFCHRKTPACRDEPI